MKILLIFYIKSLLTLFTVIHKFVVYLLDGCGEAPFKVLCDAKIQRLVGMLLLLWDMECYKDAEDERRHLPKLWLTTD